MSILDIPSEQYHADNVADVPTLSASIAKVICARSPKHAWTCHPRLNPAFTRDDDDKFSIGICAHALLLEGRDAVEVIPMTDWRTNVAKELRDEARAAGRIPLLSKDWEAVQEMVAAAREQLGNHAASPPLFTDGQP